MLPPVQRLLLLLLLWRWGWRWWWRWWLRLRLRLWRCLRGCRLLQRGSCMLVLVLLVLLLLLRRRLRRWSRRLLLWRWWRALQAWRRLGCPGARRRRQRAPGCRARQHRRLTASLLRWLLTPEPARSCVHHSCHMRAPLCVVLRRRRHRRPALWAVLLNAV
jgi:hypothetical protein